MLRGCVTSIIFFSASFFATCVIGQISQRTEIGGGLGIFNYTGDLVSTFDLATSRPAATLFYRSNISRVISFRTSITGGQLAASDKNNPTDPFAVKRAASFDLFLLELSGGFEYHFLDWRDEKRKLRFTPYLFAGVGLFGISGTPNKNAEYSNIQLSIPFGGGMKYVLNPRYYVSFEFGVRKTFFDYLDNISGGNPSFKTFQYGNPNDNDNYFFTGITLTYTFYDIPCATNPYR
ncbi:MAG: outer membrane beta-barrel protein [Cytophagales bacterium]|nr:outer membrane beta-barrel protein [Cytophagales bacterium]MCA6386621.1 outer membrane beta-barrel protein [Cytophagales bacterium]MCA6389869.1 outer membrane beta-barrel protein [Cytophagales bacterium]MCA6396718.1 outer membrane beta-barrel protein [Cytophagales bacterium]MCA6398623.1 outer membrane beta-barrel protein [Cytophagales bacterium]